MVLGEDRGLTPAEAVQRAADLVRELREHYDDYGSGEAQARTQRARRHLSRLVHDVRPRHAMGGAGAATREVATPQMGHEVDREGDSGGGSGERDDSDLSSFMQGSAPWKKRPADDTTPSHWTTSVKRLTPPTSSEKAASSSTREEPADDLEG